MCVGEEGGRGGGAGKGKCGAHTQKRALNYCSAKTHEGLFIRLTGGKIRAQMDPINKTFLKLCYPVRDLEGNMVCAPVLEHLIMSLTNVCLRQTER